MIKQFSILAVFLLSTSIFAQEPDLTENPSNQHISSISSTPKDALSPGRYGISNAVGAVIGLGMGHVIQGRWQEIGWVFTLAELPLIAALPITALGAMLSGSSPSFATTSMAIFIANLAGLLGFRTWQVIDLANAPTVENILPRASYYAPREERHHTKASLSDSLVHPEIAIPVINMAF